MDWYDVNHKTETVNNTSFKVFEVFRNNKQYKVAIALTDNFSNPFELHSDYGWSRIFQIPAPYYKTKQYFIDTKFNLALNLIEQTKIKHTELKICDSDQNTESFLNTNYMTGTWVADGRPFAKHCLCSKDELLYMISIAKYKEGFELLRVCGKPNVKLHKVDRMIELLCSYFAINQLTLRARLQFFNADVALNKTVFGKNVINQIIDSKQKSLEFTIEM